LKIWNAIKSKKDEVENFRKNSLKEFENLANKILDEKSNNSLNKTRKT
jgi:hypothetical protein